MARRSGHASFFSYSIQRQYPLPWFTPVAVVGGVLFTVLISFANFVASGYELTTVYASNPSMVDQDLWFKDWPAWLTNNINATCEPANLPLNSQFFTNKSALSYTLTSISIIQDDIPTSSTSLPYLNNVIGDCAVLNITMDIDCSTSGSPTGTNALCALAVRAYTTCSMDGPNGLTKFNLTCLYNPIQIAFSPGSSSFVKVNITSVASIWWAQQLLTAYWYSTDQIVFYTLRDPSSSYNQDRRIFQGFVNFYRHHDQDDITELDFFDAQFFFPSTSSNGTFYYSRSSVQNFIEVPNVDHSDGPPIFREADRLAKTMYSAVMTDLGQTTLPPQSNIAVNAKALQFFSGNFSALHASPYKFGLPYLTDQILDGTYDKLRDDLGSGQLQVTPSTISTNYLCSVPKMKSTGNLFISILLADLVLLNTIWVLYSLIVQRFFVRSPTANYCEGCLGAADKFQSPDHRHKSTVSSAPTLPPLGLDAESLLTPHPARSSADE